MMGKDCERIIGSLNKLKDELANAILSLASSTSYRMEVLTSDHTHPTSNIPDVGVVVTNGTHPNAKEKEEVVSGSSIVAAISSAIGSFEEDSGKLDGLESGLYTESTTFNNSYGSPWTEIQKLQSALTAVKSFGSGDLRFVGEKAALIGLLSMAMAYAVDAKCAVITYHDYIQRGYDAKYNDKEPSITFKRPNKKDTIGNIDQDFEENVNVERPTYDPF